MVNMKSKTHINSRWSVSVIKYHSVMAEKKYFQGLRQDPKVMRFNASKLSLAGVSEQIARSAGGQVERSATGTNHM